MLLAPLAFSIGVALPAHAILDINDQGPVLSAGQFALRVTNAGILGNAFFAPGLSFDPSFEYPRGSGHELLGHAELWVGARRDDGSVRVSGGPMLEFRPTPSPDDSVRIVNAGDPGGLWNVDDDGDGRIDEDPVNGIDDDGDGRVDEDFDLPSQQMLAAEYVDDRPEAIAYGYPEGEQHSPLGLSVHQEAFAWSTEALSGIAGLRFTVTNHGAGVLHDVRLGVYADLDSRDRNDAGGHIHDRLDLVDYSLVIPEKDAFLSATGAESPTFRKHCFTRFEGRVPVVSDGLPGSGLPCGAIVGLTHTTDWLGYIVNDAFASARAAREKARAPRRDSTFRYHVFIQDLPSGQGGPPRLDVERYAALEGSWPEARIDGLHDYAVLLSCGPFATLAPGQSVSFSVALVAAPDVGTIRTTIPMAGLVQRGTKFNLIPDDSVRHVVSVVYRKGVSGINGHEMCYEPPDGIVFEYEPHCPQKFVYDPLILKDPDSPLNVPLTEATEVTYSQGHCTWSDFDCDACTGNGGFDTVHPWNIDVARPPQPRARVTAGDREATVEWDDSPEVALATGRVGSPTWRFAGYKLYRLDDWRRQALLPASEKWERIAVASVDTADGGVSLATLTNAAVAPDTVIQGTAHHPVGRYRYTETGLLDGFDYLYGVTAFARLHVPGTPPSMDTEYESPFIPTFADRVVPHTRSVPGPPHVWAVPNPYRAGAEWERPPVPGDVFTRHIDFLGLPRERVTLRIYTVSGDLVAQIDHDGGQGDGQVSWNLITRSGQDAMSGIYLFTVSGPSGHEVGRFVVIR